MEYGGKKANSQCTISSVARLILSYSEARKYWKQLSGTLGSSSASSRLFKRHGRKNSYFLTILGTLSKTKPRSPGSHGILWPPGSLLTMPAYTLGIPGKVHWIISWVKSLTPSYSLLLWKPQVSCWRELEAQTFERAFQRKENFWSHLDEEKEYKLPS